MTVSLALQRIEELSHIAIRIQASNLIPKAECQKIIRRLSLDGLNPGSPQLSGFGTIHYNLLLFRIDEVPMTHARHRLKKLALRECVASVGSDNILLVRLSKPLTDATVFKVRRARNCMELSLAEGRAALATWTWWQPS